LGPAIIVIVPLRTRTATVGEHDTAPASIDDRRPETPETRKKTKKNQLTFSSQQPEVI
jgi:hypothetical protein